MMWKFFKFFSFSRMQAEGCCDILTGTELSGEIPKALIMPQSHLDRAHLLIPMPDSACLCTKFALFPSGCWEIPPFEFKWQLRVFFFSPQNFKLLRELCAQSLCETNCMEITQIISGLSGLPWHYPVAVLLWCSLEWLDKLSDEMKWLGKCRLNGLWYLIPKLWFYSTAKTRRRRRRRKMFS